MAAVETTEADGVLTINLNSPETRNTLWIGLLDRLQGVFEQTRESRSRRVVVIRHAGETFSAGMDLKGRSGVSTALEF